MDIVVLTALAIEGQAVVHALGNCSPYGQGRNLWVGQIENLRVLVFPMNSAGNVSSAQNTERAIHLWHPRCIVLVGIAGGARDVRPAVNLGDVLVPEQVVNYELGRVRPNRIERRYEVHRPDPDFLAAARELTTDKWASQITTPTPDRQDGRVVPRSHFGPMLSGEMVLDDDSTINELRLAWPLAIGVDMESFGVAYSSYHGKVDFFVAKAVSDFADGGKDDSWQRYAAECAARFAIALLSSVVTSLGSGPSLKWTQSSS